MLTKHGYHPAEYIRQEKPQGCIFCLKAAENQDRKNLILYRGKLCYVMLNRYPYTNGHLMVIPYEHVDSPTKLPPETLTEMMLTMNICLQVLQKAMNPDGFNIGINLGAAAGAGIKDHLHIHIVPRWIGDTNFMPVLDDTRIIVEALDECYNQLEPLFAEYSSGSQE